jgi:hypothetical protein
MHSLVYSARRRTDIPLLVLGGLPDPFEGGSVGGVIAVRKVEPCHVHSGIDEGLQLRQLPAGRSDGANNLGSTCSHQ